VVWVVWVVLVAAEDLGECPTSALDLLDRERRTRGMVMILTMTARHLSRMLNRPSKRVEYGLSCPPDFLVAKSKLHLNKFSNVCTFTKEAHALKQWPICQG
jgi:hypothetical protein